MKRLGIFFVIVFACASCDKLFHREAPEASAPIATTSASATLDAAALADDEEEESAGTTETDASDRDATFGTGLGLFGTNSGDGGDCPRAIFPGYCRRRCQSFASRKVSMHARRIGNPSRAGIGTCGGFNVFAEDATGGGGVVEYYDAATDALAGAIDSRQPGCNRYGTIPACKPAIAWGPPHPQRGGGLGSLLK